MLDLEQFNKLTPTELDAMKIVLKSNYDSLFTRMQQAIRENRNDVSLYAYALSNAKELLDDIDSIRRNNFEPEDINMPIDDLNL